MLRPGPDALDRPSVPLTDDVVGEVIEAFQPHYAESIGRERGRAMTRNLGDVLLMLAEWKREDDAATAGPPPVSPEPPPAPEPVPHRRPKRRKFPAEVP